MNDAKWFGLAIAASGAIAIANVVFGVERLMFVCGLFTMWLAAVFCLRGRESRFGRMLVVTQATSLVLALVLTLYLWATHEATRRVLSLSDVMMILGMVFSLVSLVIGFVAGIAAYCCGTRYRLKHAVLAIASILFVSITTELDEKLKRNRPQKPPTIQMAPRNN